MPFVEASSTQRVSAQVQKNLYYNLTDAEIAAVRTGMGPVRVGVYRVDNMPADTARPRRVFELARLLVQRRLSSPATRISPASIRSPRSFA